MSTQTAYMEWLESRAQHPEPDGIRTQKSKLHTALFPFQADLTAWALRRGRAAIFADCGLGKTLMQLVWAHRIARETKRRVLILTPLAVGFQTVAEGEKFDLPCVRFDTELPSEQIVVANYERLHYLKASDFAAVVCDESSILKNFDGKRRNAITEFLRTVEYRLLCTATPSPNDYVELGTSSEALGELGHMDMLGMFFKNDENSLHPMWHDSKWRFKKHAERDFWRWMCSWARAIRKPSDIGHDDNGFVLPKLIERETIIKPRNPREGLLFDLHALNLHEQREEQRRTIGERCEAAAALVNHNRPAIMWCHLNKESETLAAMVPDAVEVTGSNSDDDKEAKFMAFTRGDVRVLVTKPRIGGFGMNWQHCAHQTFFPSHSYEQYYQAVRRSWRYGQTKPVTIDIVASEGSMRTLQNLKRKNEAAEKMFSELVAAMNHSQSRRADDNFPKAEVLPQWL